MNDDYHEAEAADAHLKAQIRQLNEQMDQLRAALDYFTQDDDSSVSTTTRWAEAKALATAMTTKADAR